MNTEEARFVLRAYRAADGRSGADPLFQEALAQAHRDPQLLQWLATEQAFDTTVTSKIDSVPVPPGLRESILIGARASRRHRHWWMSPSVLAVAAAVVAVVGISWWFRPATNGSVIAAADPQALAQFALHNLTHGPHGHATAEGAVAVERALATHAGPIARAADLDLSEAAFRGAGCQAFDFAGRRVFEVCFKRDGHWFHLYVFRPEAAAGEGRQPATGGRSLVFLEQDKLAAAAWENAGHIYALASSAGREALQRLL